MQERSDMDKLLAQPNVAVLATIGPGNRACHANVVPV